MYSNDDSNIKTSSNKMTNSPPMSEVIEHIGESKSDNDKDEMTLNMMIDAKCDEKINSANSSRRGSISMTTAS